jgi:hypothetical protein
VDEAVPVVKQIVSEILLPDEDKAIKPVNVGGVAGGDKYVAFLSLVCAPAMAAVLTLRLLACFVLPCQIYDKAAVYQIRQGRHNVPPLRWR